MKLYADHPVRRTTQVAGDALLLVWVVTWVALARAVHGAVLTLAGPGREVNQAAGGLAARLRDAGDALDGTPLVGDGLRAPFDGAGDAANRIAAAGTSQVAAVEDLALWLSLTIGAVPILVALAYHLPRRWRFAREATAAQRLVDSGADLELFALRALGRQPLHRLALVSPDPAGEWRRGVPETVRALAHLELADAGLLPPSEAPVRSEGRVSAT